MALRREEADKGDERETARAFCKKHAIRLDVWDARHYTRWYAVDDDGPLRDDDLAPIRKAYAGLRGLGSTLFKARQSDGWIIPRYAPPGLELEPIYPEIRPDDLVKRAGLPTRHYHGDKSQYPLSYPKVWPEPGWILLSKDRHTPKAMADHIKRHDDHLGVNRHDVHEHVEWAKYCFPETVTVKIYWPHDHANIKSPTSLDNHVQSRRKHDGKDVRDWHWHEEWVKDPDQNLAKRIDMHPLAVGLFRDAKRLYWQLEGCIKDDAVLSEILKRSLKASVLSVPSVTLWDAPELPRVIRQYNVERREVAIGIDADGTENPQVMTQALLFHTVLREYGVSALVVAPPYEAWQKNRDLKGHDDHLEAGGRLEELEVEERLLSDDVDELIEERTRHWQYRVRLNAARVMRSLSLHATDGQFCASIPALARVMEPGRDWNRSAGWFRKPVPITDEVKAKAMQRHRNSGVVKAIQRSLDDLEEIGAITIEGKRKTSRNYWSGREEWRKPPTIHIAPELQAKRLRRKLGK